MEITIKIEFVYSEYSYEYDEDYRSYLYTNDVSSLPFSLARYAFNSPVKITEVSYFDSSYSRKLMESFLEKFEDRYI